MENIELIKFALEQGADVNEASKRGYTPLHLAISENSLDVVQFLVSQGADIHAKGDQGRTPLHSAVWRSSLDMANFLFRKVRIFMLKIPTAKRHWIVRQTV